MYTYVSKETPASVTGADGVESGRKRNRLVERFGLNQAKRSLS
jgi:hypothetical protein